MAARGGRTRREPGRAVRARMPAVAERGEPGRGGGSDGSERSSVARRKRAAPPFSHGRRVRVAAKRVAAFPRPSHASRPSPACRSRCFLREVRRAPQLRARVRTQSRWSHVMRPARRADGPVRLHALARPSRRLPRLLRRRASAAGMLLRSARGPRGALVSRQRCSLAPGKSPSCSSGARRPAVPHARRHVFPVSPRCTALHHARFERPHGASRYARTTQAAVGVAPRERGVRHWLACARERERERGRGTPEALRRSKREARGIRKLQAA